MTIRVGVVGATGRMGSQTCAAVDSDADLELVARVGSGDPLSALVDANAAVAVDFTTPGAVKDNVRFCLANGIHAVVGTTGLGEEDLADIETWTREHGANAVVAPNFAVGAVLMMVMAAKAAPHFDRVEIIERHHERKLDAPSGTALRTARMINEAREEAWLEVTGAAESLPGSRGGTFAGINIHSVRVPGSVAHQEVILGTTGETLTIRHDSIDRASFMPGVLLAIRNVASRPGLTVGLEALLDL